MSISDSGPAVADAGATLRVTAADVPGIAAGNPESPPGADAGLCRKLRYRGVIAGDLWLHTRMAGLNLRRLLNLGPARHAGAWVLA